MSANSPKVLIVHDNEDAGLMYALCLSTFGFQARLAQTVDEVFLLADAAAPDVILADVGGAGCEGVDVARRLRRDRRTRNTGIIVLTGHSNPRIRREAQQAGCDRFLLKPCVPDELATEIRALVSGGATSSGPGTRACAPAPGRE